MKSVDVAQYIRNNPQFFEDHADILTEIKIPHPYGGRTISLGERQLLTLREKNKELEKTVQEMVEIARNNDALQHKVHQFACALLEAAPTSSMPETIIHNLREIFSVQHVALRSWQVQPPSAEVLTFTDQQSHPVCTHHALHDTLSWFGEGALHLRSFSYLPLRAAVQAIQGQPAGGQSIGLLILASEDVQRFYPEMGTLFLQRIAEIASSALGLHHR